MVRAERGHLVVVVPAMNEAARIGGCLDSLAAQRAPLTVLVSDNASDDATAAIASRGAGRHPVTVRTTAERLAPVAHFVSAARWALESSDAATFAMLAGDDAWSPGFAAVALDALDDDPDADVAFPTFIWTDGTTERTLAPVSFLTPSPMLRQLKALALPDGRELANLVYGVYRRDAFADLVEGLARAGERFASDYAAAVRTVARHRVVAAHGAVGFRSVRPGADLLGRVGIAARPGAGILDAGLQYFRLNYRINRGIAGALRALGSGLAPVWVQAVRAPQWFAAIPPFAWRSATGGARQPGSGGEVARPGARGES